MARERSELEREETASAGDGTPDFGGNSGLIDRRSYLKLAGAASAVGVGAAASGAGAAAADDYEVIEASNEYIWLEDGEVFENKIIDFSNGNWHGIYGRDATNWTVRNVAFVGTHTHDQHAFSVSDAAGGTSVIENVYLADGCIRPDQYSSHGQCGIYVGNEHSGHIDVRNCNIQNWPNNGIYASGPGYSGNVGTVHIDNCYAANNYVSSYRVAAAGDAVTNCVAHNDGGRYDGRPFWGWHPGRMTISDCEFDAGDYANGAAIYLGRNGESSELSIENTNYTGTISSRGAATVNDDGSNGSNPDLSIPDGVPTTPEEAASNQGTDEGGRSESGDPGPRHVFEFVGDGEPADYYFEIEDGSIEPSTDGGATIDESLQWVSEDGTRAAGRVTDGRHAWGFDALLTDVTVRGGADAIVDGRPSNLDRYPRDGASGDDWKGEMPWHEDALENTIVVNGAGTDGATQYEFSVGGAVEKATLEGASIDAQDVVEDGTVRGTVGSWIDAFRFGGELEQLTVDGPAAVRVNDEVIDPVEYGATHPHTLTIVGRGIRSSYEITVDGEFDGDGSIEEAIVADSTVEGSIDRSVHRFDFAGTLSDLTFVDGDAHVYLDGERIDPDEYGGERPLPHALVIDGSEASGPTTYSFTVDGRIAKTEYRDANVNEDDVIEDGTVRGGVDGWIDAYWFDGDVVDFTLLGDAAVDVEYNVRDR